METNIKRLIKSVTITTLIVLLSVPIWNYTSSKKPLSLADSYGHLDIAVDVGGFSALTLIEDERVFESISPTDVAFRNQNSTSKTFEILLLVTKDSTIDTKYLNVSLDKEVFALKDLEKREDAENNYFLLKKVTLDGYSEVQYKTRLWLSANENKIDENAILTTNFLAE